MGRHFASPRRIWAVYIYMDYFVADKSAYSPYVKFNSYKRREQGCTPLLDGSRWEPRESSAQNTVRCVQLMIASSLKHDVECAIETFWGLGQAPDLLWDHREFSVPFNFNNCEQYILVLNYIYISCLNNKAHTVCYVSVSDRFSVCLSIDCGKVIIERGANIWPEIRSKI